MRMLYVLRAVNQPHQRILVLAVQSLAQKRKEVEMKALSRERIGLGGDRGGFAHRAFTYYGAVHLVPSFRLVSAGPRSPPGRVTSSHH